MNREKEYGEFCQLKIHNIVSLSSPYVDGEFADAVGFKLGDFYHKVGETEDEIWSREISDDEILNLLKNSSQEDLILIRCLWPEPKYEDVYKPGEYEIMKAE